MFIAYVAYSLQSEGKIILYFCFVVKAVISFKIVMRKYKFLHLLFCNYW